MYRKSMQSICEANAYGGDTATVIRFLIKEASCLLSKSVERFVNGQVGGVAGHAGPEEMSCTGCFLFGPGVNLRKRGGHIVAEVSSFCRAVRPDQQVEMGLDGEPLWVDGL